MGTPGGGSLRLWSLDDVRPPPLMHLRKPGVDPIKAMHSPMGNCVATFASPTEPRSPKLVRNKSAGGIVRSSSSPCLGEMSPRRGNSSPKSIISLVQEEDDFGKKKVHAAFKNRRNSFRCSVLGVIGMTTMQKG
mmetsp:Transcript_25907/g.72296  ORF Transcript_25907/g.72296 Transcript_25907/m.72296 type:complete len:134 (+) Transcript_25907:64-465(+)